MTRFIICRGEISLSRDLPFLSGRVPQLKSDRSVLEIHSFRKEIDPDGGLVGVVEGVVHKAGYERRFSHALFSQEHKLELSQRV